ncbi:glycosyltransferase [Rosistilla oblonga]|uniref:D-inositol 3-phosphate glycosyltransferase n=1 Tax=Rosistilla oblonga TaxID=2527990 RepID=A0A518J1W6_9BACT|nr:glycosyltransferase [Rosistilla oblonga]QDV59321.1 D-inositol 3-phosphate glycosyltransferase [Rosistilla oblonga]
MTVLSTIATSDVVVVIRAPLEQYPPSLNQVALLSRAGFRVTVVDTYHEDYKRYQFAPQDKIERIHAVEHTQNHKQTAPPRWERIRRAISFRRCVRRTIANRKPAVVIAYDPNAMIAVGKIWQKQDAPKLIWHYHELFLPEQSGGGFFTKRAVQFAANNCQHTDLVVFPDRARSRVYKEKTNRDFNELIVMNCPARLDNLPNNRLGPRLAELNVPTNTKVVFFQGWIGPSRCFEAIVESMKRWPTDSVLVLIGPVSDQYRISLQDLGDQVGVGSRIFFLGTVPYQELMSWTVGADLGLAIVSDSVEKDLSWKFSAGAVNKRFEYMAVGVPQIANQGPGMQEIIEDTGVGRLVDPNSPQEIGTEICELLSHEGECEQVSVRARSVHESKYCYERQFQPLLDRVQTWIQGPK